VSSKAKSHSKGFSSLFNHKTKISDYSSEVWRIVESQEDVATLHIVDTQEEQDLLERLLDESKPRYRAGTERMHYLLKTAFRYPPLQYGSRFGSRLMPSYFYASEEYQTALCETAYYRFLFLDHMQQAYEAPIRSEYELFKVKVATQHCLDLTSQHYHKVKSKLLDPESYNYTHRVGEWALTNKIEIIRFYSARKTQGINVAVSEPESIRSPTPKMRRNWQCLTRWDLDDVNNSSVSFRSREFAEVHEFKRAHYCNKRGRFLSVN